MNLIEIIIYITILAIVLVMMIGFSWDIFQGNSKTSSYREVQQNAYFAMDAITRKIQAASGINNPTPGNSSNSLSLKMSDINLDPTIFDLVDNNLRITWGSDGPYQLNSGQAKITNLNFTNLSASGKPATIKIEMAISHLNPENRNEYQAILNLKSAASLRAP